MSPHGGFGHGAAQTGREILDIEIGIQRQELTKMGGGRLGRDSAGDIATGVPSHPICEDSDTDVRHEGETVLVPAPDLSDMTQTDDGEMMGQREG